MSVSKQLVSSAQSDASCLLDRTNRRLAINHYPSDKPASRLAEEWVSIARENELEKIWLWSYLQDVPDFLSCGFQLEGIIAQKDDQPPASLAYFINSERGKSQNQELEDRIIQQVCASPARHLLPLPGKYVLRFLGFSDCPAISKLLSGVFTSYPSPVKNPGYIQDLMGKGCLFAGAFDGAKLISVAAAYPDKKLWRCEITDCATLPEYRGQSLTTRLIRLLEPEIFQAGPYTLFTLARALSHGMNRVFYRLGYRYQGRLINNCDIAGGFEDMNLWVKY